MSIEDIWSLVPADLVPALIELRRDPAAWQEAKDYLVVEAAASLRRLGTPPTDLDFCWALEAAAERYLQALEAQQHCLAV